MSTATTPASSTPASAPPATSGRAAFHRSHFVTALRYVALNPVRARLVPRAQDWPWSSTRAHLAGQVDHVVTVAPALDRVGDFAAFLSEPFDEAFTYAALRKAEAIGRPIGSPEWLEDMETRTGLPLRPRKRGPKPRSPDGAQSTPDPLTAIQATSLNRSSFATP